MKLIEHKEGSAVKDLIDALDEAVMKRLVWLNFIQSIKNFWFCVTLKDLWYRQEGIIIKKPSSRYVLNERIDDWIKIKPEYLDALGDSLDLLIVGKFLGISII